MYMTVDVLYTSDTVPSILSEDKDDRTHTSEIEDTLRIAEGMLSAAQPDMHELPQIVPPRSTDEAVKAAEECSEVRYRYQSDLNPHH